MTGKEYMLKRSRGKKIYVGLEKVLHHGEEGYPKLTKVDMKYIRENLIDPALKKK